MGTISPDRRKFLRLVAAGSATLGASTFAQAQGNLPNANLNFDLDFPVKFDDPAIYKFLGSSASRWKAPVRPKSGYTVDPNRSTRMAITDRYPKVNTPIRLYWTVQETYAVYQGPLTGQQVAIFDVVIPNSIEVQIEMDAILFIKDKIPPAAVAKIQGLFDKFDPSINTDPVGYAQSALASDPSIGLDWFLIRNTYQILKKTGTERREESRLDTIKALYDGGLPRGSCSILKDPVGTPIPCDGETSYFTPLRTRFVLVKSSVLDGLPNRPVDPAREIEIPAGENPGEKLKRVFDNDAEQSQCDSLKEETWPVLTIGFNVETRWSWTTVHWVVCGNDIYFDFLHIETQDSKVELWIDLRYPPSYSAIIKVLTKCADDAILAGAVAGLVLSDFTVGLAAFKAAFYVCVTEHAEDMIACLIPNLAIVTTVTTPWH